jgi:glycosyltransferase involved in cell wall biosynthesis
MSELSTEEKPLLSDLISVVVCTRNRAAKLPQCLSTLLAMNAADGFRWELVCVDNNSTDQTKQVIEEFASSSRIPIRYVFERVQTISSARNAGLRQALGDIIVFTDDDCLVDRNWLGTIWKEFRADALLAMLSGRVELQDQNDLPICIRSFKERITVDPTNVFSVIGTSNMAFKRDVIESIGGFDPDFGAGTPLLGSEDSDFVYRALKAGFKATYSPDVLVLHDHGRRSGLDRRKIEGAYVISRGAFYLKHMLKGDPQITRLAYWESTKFAKQVLFKSNAGESRWDAARLLGYLLKGFFLYLLVCIRRIGGASTSNQKLDRPTLKSGRPAVPSS